MISEEDLEKIRSRADVVQVIGERIPLKRAGRHFKGLCPFHQEKTPSFTVNPERQIYHCFGCGEGGNVFSFLMKIDGTDFPEAVDRLASRYGIVLSRPWDGRSSDEIRREKSDKDLMLKMNMHACRLFHHILTETSEGQRGRSYLEQRGIEPQTVREQMIGYAPANGNPLTQALLRKKAPLELAVKLGLVKQTSSEDSGDFYDFFRDRLIFSIVSSDERVIGFSGRALENGTQPKYLNSPESAVYHKGSSFLGLQAAKSAIRENDEVILVEGNFDMVRLHQGGIRNAVAPLGTALTEQQIRQLSRLTRRFLLLFDGDAAGSKAAVRSLEAFLPLGLSPRVVLLPQGEDPDSFVRKEGPSRLQEMIHSARPLLEVQIDHILQGRHGGPDRKAEAVREVVRLISRLPGEIEKNLYIQRVSDQFGLPESLLRAHRVPPRSREKNEGNFPSGSGDKAKDRLPPLEKTVIEILLSGPASLGSLDLLFKEIESTEFSHPSCQRLWSRLKEDYALHGDIEVARILSELTDEGDRRVLSAMSLSGDRWQESGQEAGKKAAEDCMKSFKLTKIKGRLNHITEEIREAEKIHDLMKIKDLLSQKDRLIREMTVGH